MPIVYQDAPEIEVIAEDLIAEYHPHLEDARIRIIFRSEHVVSSGRDIWGTAKPLSARDAFLLGADFLIEIAEDVWCTLDDWKRRALIDHELCHCVLNDKGEWGSRGHSVEEFTEIIQRYGNFTDCRREYAEAAEEWLRIERFAEGDLPDYEKPPPVAVPVHCRQTQAPTLTNPIDATVWRPTVYSRNGAMWLSCRNWRAEYRTTGIKAFSLAKDALDEQWLSAVVGDLTKLVSGLMPTRDFVVTAPGPRHSHFIGVKHFASLAAERVATAIGAEYRECFAPTMATARGHWPNREKEPPKLIDAPARVLLVDDLATSGATMQHHIQALREKGSEVGGMLWVQGEKVSEQGNALA